VWKKYTSKQLSWHIPWRIPRHLKNNFVIGIFRYTHFEVCLCLRDNIISTYVTFTFMLSVSTYFINCEFCNCQIQHMYYQRNVELSVLSFAIITPCSIVEIVKIWRTKYCKYRFCTDWFLFKPSNHFVLGQFITEKVACLF